MLYFLVYHLPVLYNLYVRVEESGVQTDVLSPSEYPLTLSVSLSSPLLALKLPLGKTTVMHLVARETLPEPNSQGNQLCVSLPSFHKAFHTLNNLKRSMLPDFIYRYTWLQFWEQPLVQVIGLSLNVSPRDRPLWTMHGQ